MSSNNNARIFEVGLSVTDADLESTYNHVHHARAFVYLEQARLRFLESLGFPTEIYMQRGLFWVITNIEASYLREIRAGEILVTCENPRIISKALVLEQKLYNERNKLAVTGKATSKLLLRSTGRSTDIPEELCHAVLNITNRKDLRSL